MPNSSEHHFALAKLLSASSASLSLTTKYLHTIPSPITRTTALIHVQTRVVLDSWVVSQIWLNSDSNESSQSRVGRENQGYESSQSRVTLIVIWVRVESTGYCLSQSWVNYFSRRKRQDLAVICNFTGKEPTYSYIRPHLSPPVNNFFPN